MDGRLEVLDVAKLDGQAPAEFNYKGHIIRPIRIIPLDGLVAYVICEVCKGSVTSYPIMPEEVRVHTAT